MAIRHSVSGAILALAVGTVPVLAGPHHGMMIGDRGNFGMDMLPSWCAGVLAHPQSHTRRQINYCMAVDGD